MSVWNKYGEIKDGKITAGFKCTGPDIDYAGCYKIYNLDPAGNKNDRPAVIQMVGNKPAAFIDGTLVAYLPTDWTQLVGQIRERQPLKATCAVLWRGDHFAAFVDMSNA